VPFQPDKVPSGTLRYEAGLIVAEGDFGIAHGRFSGFGAAVNWIAADIVRIHDGVLVEHWDVIQDKQLSGNRKVKRPCSVTPFRQLDITPI
jgi:predicted SnoaL-like aldol condensation-catalyzing enzyme